jgi:hypothetical protein
MCNLCYKKRCEHAFVIECLGSNVYSYIAHAEYKETGEYVLCKGIVSISGECLVKAIAQDVARKHPGYWLCNNAIEED